MAGSRKKQLPPADVMDEDTIINEFAQATYEDETPPDIDEFLSEIGIAKKQYICTLKQFPPDQSGTPIFLPGQWKGSYPTIAEIGAKFGPGKYIYVFSWKVPGPTGNPKTASKSHEVILGEQWEDAHQEFIYQYSITRQKKLENLKMKAETQRILTGGNSPKSNENPMDDLLDAKNKLAALGVPVGNAGALANTGEGSILPLMLNMQQESTKLLVTMMDASQKNMMQLMGIMMQNQGGNNSFQQAMKETISMVTNVVDLKQALNPEKATMVDKIFDFMQGVAPQITAILAQPRAQARQDPMVQIAKERPEVQAVMGDPQAMDALAQKLDAQYGIAQANEILDVMGMTRSEGLKDHLKKAGYQVEPQGASEQQPPQPVQDAEVVTPEPGEVNVNPVIETGDEELEE